MKGILILHLTLCLLCVIEAQLTCLVGLKVDKNFPVDFSPLEPTSCKGNSSRCGKSRALIRVFDINYNFTYTRCTSDVECTNQCKISKSEVSNMLEGYNSSILGCAYTCCKEEVCNDMALVPENTETASMTSVYAQATSPGFSFPIGQLICQIGLETVSEDFPFASKLPPIDYPCNTPGSKCGRAEFEMEIGRKNYSLSYGSCVVAGECSNVCQTSSSHLQQHLSDFTEETNVASNCVSGCCESNRCNAEPLKKTMIHTTIRVTEASTIQESTSDKIESTTKGGGSTGLNSNFILEIALVVVVRVIVLLQ